MKATKRIYVPLIGIFIIALVAALVSAASFLIPVTAAILSYFVFSRPRRVLERLGLPNMLIATLFTSILFVATGAAIAWFAEPVANLIDDMPGLMRDGIRRIAEARADMTIVDFMAEPIALMAGAAKIVAMGGYNTTCEILSLGRPALIVPRVGWHVWDGRRWRDRDDD